MRKGRCYGNEGRGMMERMGEGKAAYHFFSALSSEANEFMHRLGR